MKNKKALLLINDKEYRVVGGSTSCSVNYNQFFAPLSDRFYQVHLVGRLDAGTESYPFPITNVRFHGVPTFGSYFQFLRLYRFSKSGSVATATLEKAIALSDVVVLTLGCFFAPDVERLCLKLRKPLIVEVIDDVVSAVSETDKYKGIKRVLALLMARKIDRYHKKLCARVPSLILGRDLYNRYNPNSGVKCVEFFENIMESEDYSFGRRLFSSGRIRLLFVGRLVPMKAVADLITAVALLRERGFSVECQIIGYGDCLSALTKQVHQLGLEKEVLFRGFVKFGIEMFECYDWADVFVLPSVGGEGVPRVLIEALGRGCLVVASDVCGISTIVKDGYTGSVVPPRRPDLVADAIEQYFGDEEYTKRVLLGAREFCLEHTRSMQIKRFYDFVMSASGVSSEA